MKIQSLLKAGLFLYTIAIPMAAQAATGAGGIGSGRLLPTAAAVLGLTAVITGRRALVRSRRTGNGRTGGIVALVLGSISLLTGGLHAATSAGGFGTGNGLAGALVAMTLGLTGIILGGLALAHSRQTS